jgi:hypothetical protein
LGFFFQLSLQRLHKLSDSQTIFIDQFAFKERFIKLT